MALGRAEATAVRHYLEALEATKPSRRLRSPERLHQRIDVIKIRLPEVGPLERLQLTQELLDLEQALRLANEPVDLTEAEARFVDVAASYSTRKGISYSSWRLVGVSAAVLRRAGVARGSHSPR